MSKILSTDRQIAAAITATKTSGKPTDYRVSGVNWGGLRIRIMPSGHASWSLIYRAQGKQKRDTLGIYSYGMALPKTWSLSSRTTPLGAKAAREAAAIVHVDVLAGNDPAAKRKASKAVEPPAYTLAKLFEDLHEASCREEKG
jgi:hypothetical protein